MKKGNILVVDDDPRILKLVKFTIESDGHNVDAASDGTAGLKKCKENNYDVVLTDLKMPKTSGLDLLQAVVQDECSASVIVITAYGTVDSAVEAMKLGAFDYIVKPFSPDELKLTVSRALERRQLLLENKRLHTELGDKYAFDNIIGTSKKMDEVSKFISKAMETNVTVLIQGESGTGKELVARAIHYNSRRKNKPFIVVNCSAIPDQLLESELFGHEQGAFTGATAKRIGKFELADSGTLFLDEIGDMPLQCQPKMLRALQEQEFERVGGKDVISVDVRIISATNRPLLEETKANRFREDLFYRLNVFSITLPQLKERKEDIPILTQHFIQLFAAKHEKEVSKCAPDVLDFFQTHDWPGNVRELENCIERAVVVSESDTITMDDLAPYLRGTSSELPAEVHSGSLSLPDAVDQLERQIIDNAMAEAKGVQAHAARELGISERILGYKIKKLRSKGNEQETAK